MVKENINKIDYDLKNLFEKVEIFEKTNRSNFYFEINAFSPIVYKEAKKEAQVKVKILKSDLNSNNNVKWSYYSNPINENSNLIERVSNINNISNDIYEVLLKRKMENIYFESLNSIYELINESVTSEEKEELQEKLEEILKSFNIENKISENFKYTLDGNNPQKTLLYPVNLKISDKFILESRIKSLGIDYVSFSNDILKIVI